MIRSRLVSSFVFLFLAMMAVPLWAGYSFLPKAIAVPGGTNPALYGIFGGSLVKSVDGGQNWIPLYITKAGLPQPTILEVDVDLLVNDTLYVRTSDPAQGLWKSVDGGQTWMPAVTGLPTSGAQVDFFKQIQEGSQVSLYLKKGSTVYKSTDRGARWLMTGTLPTADAVMDVADTVAAQMYLVDRVTLKAYLSLDDGHSWTLQGQLLAGPIQNNTVNAIHVLTTNPNRLYVSIDGYGAARGAYVSGDAAVTFSLVSGLGPFERMFTGFSGPLYATMVDGQGFYRASPDESDWNSYGGGLTVAFTLTAVNRNNRDILWGLRGGSQQQLIMSKDDGNNWTPVTAKLTPTLADPVPVVNVELPQGAPYVHAFDVTLFEDPSWALPVTLSTSGEPWLTLDTLSGTTPLSDAARINTTGLAVGTYQSTVTISAPDSFNGTVSFEVNLTVRAYGSAGPKYVISTIAGQGDGGETRTSGTALDLAIGAPRALRIGPEGKLWISAGNRLWRRDGTMLTAIAGNGTKGSAGDGLNPLSAEISDPDGIAFDSQMVPHLAEYESARIRRINSGSIRTQVEFSAFGFGTGSHSLVIDPFGNLLMANPQGILIFNGAKLQVRTAFVFVDPWGMVLDASGNLFVTDRGAHRIYKVTPTGVVTTVAGTGTHPGFDGDGGPASAARLSAPAGIAMGPDGSLYFADTGNQRIRKIAPGGTITTIAGSGGNGFGGDGYTAEYASFLNPDAVAVDADGRVFVADAGNNRVRMLVLTAEANLPMPPPGSQPSMAPKVTHVDRGGSIGGPLSPGAVFSLYGTLLSGARQTSDSIPWPTSIDDVSVTINGRPAPIFFVDPTQINGQIPFETELGTATAVVTYQGMPSAAFQFQVVAASPGVLVFDTDRAVMQNQDYSVNTADNPIRPGEIGLLYLSGIGIGTVAVPTGAAPPSYPDPLSKVNYPYMITVGGMEADVQYLGYAGRYPTLVQANIVIPNLAPGDHLIVVTVNGVSSQPLKITVGAP